MAEGIDEAAGAFATEIAPESRPRDSAGKFIRETAAPEPIFQERRVEGDPLTGDTSDGGDDPAFAAREREIADGYEEGRQSTQNRQNLRRPADNEADYDAIEDEPERFGGHDAEDDTDIQGADDDADETGGRDSRRLSVSDSETEKYEITVDGKIYHVGLQEALNGYIRQATFHQRMGQLNDAQRMIEEDYTRLQQGWAMWNKARLDYEEDVANMCPKEPDWEQEFAVDPRAAHAKQKVFQVIYGNLAKSQQQRAWREQQAAEENDRRTQKYAVNGFEKFVMDHIKVMPDEPTLKKNIQSMRRTAAAAGFSEYEVATVYDPRMLDILWKASKYDRMTAAAPRAVVTGKGRTLAPGAATPLLTGNARRNGFDDAQRQLAKTGKISDAAEVFRRLF
jgi:hypothetical protein